MATIEPINRRSMKQQQSQFLRICAPVAAAVSLLVSTQNLACAQAIPADVSAKSATGGLVYWFTANGQPPSPSHTLAGRRSDGTYRLVVPENYWRPDAQVAILDEAKGRVARYPTLSAGAAARRSAWNAALASRANLLQNADFARGGEQWTLDPVLPPASAEMKLPENADRPLGATGRVVRFEIAVPGTRPAQVQFYQRGLRLKPGAVYTVSFWAKADQPHPLQIRTTGEGADSASTGLDQRAALSPDWRHFAFVFRARPVKSAPLPAEAPRGSVAVPLRVKLDGIVQSVCVPGSFNNWNTRSNPMQRLADGKTWATMLYLTPGSYQYKFIINNTNWINDTLTPRVNDKDGNVNNVLNVAPASDTHRLNIALGEAAGNVELTGFALQAGALRAKQADASPVLSIKPTSADFKFSQTVQVPIKARGMGAQHALVTLQIANRVVDHQLLQPSDNGIARFHEVPINERLAITVSNGKQSTAFYRMVTPDEPNAVPDITLPADWVEGKASDFAGISPDAAPQNAVPASAAPNRPIMAAVGMSLVALLAGGVFWLIDSGRVGRVQRLEGEATSGTLRLVGGLGRDRLGRPTQLAPRAQVTMPEQPEALVSLERISSKINGPCLVVMQGVHAGRVFDLEGAKISIGRDLANQIVLLQDNTVSRRHAHIEVEGEQYLLVDDDSSNGTYVNGAPIAVQYTLRPGDEVQIGMTRFRFAV